MAILHRAPIMGHVYLKKIYFPGLTYEGYVLDLHS